MRRSNDLGSSSLELLLDTICNTFGGILFLAILIVVLLQRTQQNPPAEEDQPYSSQELAELKDELSQRASELRSLRQALALQEKLLDQLAPTKNHADVEELDKLQAHRDTLFDQRLSVLEKVNEVQIEINDIRERLKKLDVDLKEATEKVANNKEALSTEIKSRARPAGLPRTRRTSKTEITMIVRFDRVYSIFEYSKEGNELQLNTNDMVVTKDGLLFLSVTPKPYAGIVLSDRAECHALIARALKPFDPRTCYLALGVWDDSFDSFAFLKNSLVRLGFEYRLIPMAEGETLTWSDEFDPDVQ